MKTLEKNDVYTINEKGEVTNNHGYSSIESCKNAVEMRGFKTRWVKKGESFNVVKDGKVISRWRTAK
jgi:hypothetical protein